jgi:RHS repeat-associated protein
MSKVVTTTSPMLTTARTHFTWDEGPSLPLVLQETTSTTVGTSTTTSTTSYIYGPDGLPLEQLTGSTTYWLHHDQLGSTRLLTGSTGAVVATFTYDPYGNVTSTGSVTTALLYARQYRDAESGLQYLRARYYDPVTGQFLTRDPADLITRSPYAYAADNPLNRTDPTGMCLGWIWGVPSCQFDPSRLIPAISETTGLACLVPTPLEPVFCAISLTTGIVQTGVDASTCNWGGAAADVVGVLIPGESLPGTALGVGTTGVDLANSFGLLPSQTPSSCGGRASGCGSG